MLSELREETEESDHASSSIEITVVVWRMTECGGLMALWGQLARWALWRG